MAKRQATSQINHENWDEEDEKEEPGTFKSVSENELQNRTIKKAKRSLTSPSGDSGSSPTPFKGFTGFNKTSQPNFSFLAQTNKMEVSSTNSEKEGSQNGCQKLPAAQVPTAERSDSQSSSCAEGDKLPGEERDLEYFRMLQSLNESVMKWMHMHYSNNPFCNFWPVFCDYKSYVDDLELKYFKTRKVQSQSSTSSATAFKIPEPSQGKTSEKDASNKTAKRSADLFSSESRSFAKVAKTDSEMLYGAAFASNTTNTSTFSFGIKNSPTATSSGSQITPTTSFKAGKDGEAAEKRNTPFSFSFKSNSDNSSASEKDESQGAEQKPFSFGWTGAAAAAANSSAADAKTENEDDEYVPPKNEVQPVSEEGAFYSKRCKLFFKKGSEYVDKGIGTLHLKSLNGKTQLLVRADTTLGNILLNIVLSASLPMQRTGKNNVLIACVPNPPLDAKDSDAKEAVPMLIRVKTSEDADELLEMLNKHKS